MKELSLNILDIVQNSIRAKARQIAIEIDESVTRNCMKIVIIDDGAGIPLEMLPNVTDPYTTSRTKRRVGLGLPFLKQHAELAGGGLKIDSKEGIGTHIEATFYLNHIDRQPMGDISGVLKILMIANPEIEFEYKHNTDQGIFRLNTVEIKQIFEVKNLNDNSLMEDIRNMIFENLRTIGASE